jgi:hypothetical protein
MASSEDLAQYVAANTQVLTEAENKKGAGRLVPPPPKPGEIIICQQCGKPMYPQDFSKDPKIRRHEFKWHIHYACEQEIWDLVDRQTPGLLAERTNGVPQSRRPMHLGSPRNKH